MSVWRLTKTLMKVSSANSTKAFSNRFQWVKKNWRSYIHYAKKRRLPISPRTQWVTYETNSLPVWNLKCRKNFKCWGSKMRKHPSISVQCSCSRIMTQSRKTWGISNMPNLRISDRTLRTSSTTFWIRVPKAPSVRRSASSSAWSVCLRVLSTSIRAFQMNSTSKSRLQDRPKRS